MKGTTVVCHVFIALLSYFKKFWYVKYKDLPRVSEDKYCRDDLILNLKKESNLSIREIAEILGINRDIVSRKERKGVRSQHLT